MDIDMASYMAADMASDVAADMASEVADDMAADVASYKAADVGANMADDMAFLKNLAHLLLGSFFKLATRWATFQPITIPLKLKQPFIKPMKNLAHLSNNQYSPRDKKFIIQITITRTIVQIRIIML